MIVIHESNLDEVVKHVEKIYGNMKGIKQITRYRNALAL
jgi:hypothetical protein